MYRVETDDQAQLQVEVLPAHALPLYAELRTILKLNPLAGAPLNKDNPAGGVYTLTFGGHGEGLVYYLILESPRRVDILAVRWLA